MTPPFTWKQRLQFFFWVVLLLLAILAIVWMIFYMPARQSIQPSQRVGQASPIRSGGSLTC